MVFSFLTRNLHSAVQAASAYVTMQSDSIGGKDRNDFFISWKSKLLLTGTYSPVSFDMTQEEIKYLFGEERDHSTIRCKDDSPRVLKYDEIEFHFNDDIPPKLTLIYSDENATGSEAYQIAIKNNDFLR